MNEIKVTCNGMTKMMSKSSSYYDASQLFMVSHAVVALVDNELMPLYETIQRDVEVKFLDMTHISGYKIYQAGLKYLFQVAMEELYPKSEVRFLHSVPKGILCELFLDHDLTKEDISKIKGKMAHIVSSKERFLPYHLTPKDAYHYLLQKKEEEKAKMIQFASTDLVTMYRLKDHFNYFYNDMPYDTSVLDLFDLVDIGKNRVVLVCPSIQLNGRVPEYVHYENIVQNFMKSQKWLRLMKTPYLANLNEKVANNQIQEFVLTNELLFHEEIMKACDQILRNPKIRFILIAGPSSSGKTTTMKRISTTLKARGYEPIELSTDDFFVDKVNTPKDEHGEYDFECLQAIDLELFNQTLKKLLDGENVSVPEYDFVAGKKIYKDKNYELKENSIVLIEGLHCLNDDLLPYIANEYKYKIYLSPFMPLNIDRHNYISTLDLRLIRRLTRDRRTRGRKVDDTIFEWQKVRNGEENYIFPYVYQADLILNTALSYEPGVLKVYALPLLYAVDMESPYYGEARRLIRMLEPFFPISSEVVPKDSILREFIG